MKKNTLFLAIAFAALSLTAQAQTQVGYRSPNPGTGNIGYKMAIEPQFDYIALDFSEGMACVRFKINEFHTYIDTTGKPVFDKKYVNVGPFSNGYAAVEVEPGSANYSFIDHKGKPLTDQTYRMPRDFSEGYAAIKVDVSGGGHYRYNYMDSEGKLVGEPRFLAANNFSEGHAAVQGSNKNWMVLNKRFVASASNLPYEEINEFHEGLARVRIGERYGFIDTLGNLKIPMTDDYCDYSFSEGLCLIKRAGRFGYMDMTGKVVIPCRFTYAEAFSCSRAVVSESAPDESGMITERGVIDHNGKFVVEEKKFDFIETFSEDYAIVSKDGKKGFINVNGKVVIPMIYENARPFHEGYAAVRVNRKWGFLKLDLTGEKPF